MASYCAGEKLQFGVITLLTKCTFATGCEGVKIAEDGVKLGAYGLIFSLVSMGGGLKKSDDANDYWFHEAVVVVPWYC